MAFSEPLDPKEPLALRVVAAWEWSRPMRVTLTNGTVRDGTLRSRGRGGFELADSTSMHFIRFINYRDVDSIARIPDPTMRQVPTDVVDAFIELYRVSGYDLDPAQEEAIQEFLGETED